MKRKINQMAETCIISGGYDFYESNREQYEFLLNPDPGIKERSIFYIPDEDMHMELLRLLAEPMDSVSVLIGCPGIGKTSDIQNCFQTYNGVPRFCDEFKAIILNCTFDGSFPQTDNPEFFEAEIAKRIASVCAAIERNSPSVGKQFYSAAGQQDFLEFILRTNPEALEGTTSFKVKSIEQTLQLMEKREYFIYAASKLKFYLSMPQTAYERMLVIVDNIEAQQPSSQNQLVLDFSRLYSCLRNIPDILDGKRIYVNLLFSMRTDTYFRLKNLMTVLPSGVREIRKQMHIALGPYFRKKADLVCGERGKQNYEKWKEAETALFTICEKFDSKYSHMIMGLANKNVRQAMIILKKILSSPIWISKDACTDKSVEGGGGYIFNNITVIRAIACGKSLVYFNSADQLIPNVFYNMDSEDNSIISLYIIAYFKKRYDRFMGGAGSAVFLTDLLQDFTDVFAQAPNLDARIKKTIGYLCKHGILCPGIPKKSWGVSANLDENFFYLSFLGMEIWNMLAADSVLLELYREDYYQEYTSETGGQFKSSYQLMREDNQEAIFIELYRLLSDLLVKEELPLLNAVERCGAIKKYNSIFGVETIVEHLSVGVGRSVDFSGKSESDAIREYRNRLFESLPEKKVHK